MSAHSVLSEDHVINRRIGASWGMNIFIFALLFCLVSVRSFAQLEIVSGTIIGSVTDQTGAAVPGANVVVKNIETGTVRNATTDERGRYEVPVLKVGKYEVSAAVAGFQTLVRGGIELTLGRTAIVDIALQVGQVSETVTVAGDAALVETTSATVSNLVDEKRVAELPLNGRDLNQLAFLQPGVLKSPEGSDFTGGQGDKLVVNGARGQHNLYLLDGVNNADYNNSAAGASGAYIGAESIKEFQVITNNYSAQYQSAPGAILSAVTKSGTNTPHGSIFEFLRNDNFDAAQWEDNALGNGQPEFKRNQFGATLGGPIRKDRTFFFASYEGLRERLSSTATARVPTIAARSGNLPTQTINVAAQVRPYLDLLPVPGVGNSVSRNFGDGTVEIAGTARQPTEDDFLAGKVDHQFSGGKAGFLSGTYNFDKSAVSPYGVLGDLGAQGNANKKHTISLQHTSILSPTTLNELKFGFSFSEPQGEIPLSKKDFSNLVFVPGRTLLGIISAADISTFGYSQIIQVVKQNAFSWNEGLSLNRGRHSLRLGTQFDYFRIFANELPNGSNGEFTFRSLPDFLRGTPDNFLSLLKGQDDGSRNLKQLMVGAFVQDNYTVFSSLTLNLGLRYEFVTVPEERDGKIAALVHFMDPKMTVGKLMTNPTKKSFSPRFGFAWAPGSRKLSVRGGFGIFYDLPLMRNYRSAMVVMPPFMVQGSVSAAAANAAGNPLVFPNAYTVNAAQLLANPTLQAFQYDAKNTYAYRWSLTIQREFGGGWVTSVGYTGARALHLWVQEEPNINRWQGWPNQPTGRKFWPAITGVNPINPAWSTMRFQLPFGNSYYQGLALMAQKRMSYGLQFQTAYTWSKAIDQGAGLTGGRFPTESA
jgi:hypothetical protein